MKLHFALILALGLASSFAQEEPKRKTVDFNTDQVLKSEKEFAVNPHDIKRNIRNKTAIAGGSALLVGSSLSRSSKFKAAGISTGVASILLSGAYYLNKSIYENEYPREDIIKMLKKEAVFAQNDPEVAKEVYNYKDVISKFQFSNDLKTDEAKIEFVGKVIDKLTARSIDSEDSIITDDELKGILFKEFNDHNVELLENELFPILHLQYKTYEEMKEDQRINDERREKWEKSSIKKTLDKAVDGVKGIIVEEVKGNSFSN